MKREERRQAIIDLLIADRAVDLDDLAGRFAVSKMTVHRDLDDLEQAGLLRKIRGGATIEAGTRFESDFRIRALQDAPAKARMVQAARALIEPGMTVMINDGSTAALLGSGIADLAPLTVITHNAAAIAALKDQPRVTLIAPGGQFDPRYNGFFGLVTEESLSRLRADLAFISAPAIDGLTAFHMDETVLRAKRAMMDASARSCLLVHHRCFGRRALHAMADLGEFDALITDAPPSPQTADALARAGHPLTIASE
ncbi:MAG: DeoR/GlpR family DNA-binding transcription regulator [Paracoccus sp. (in: a-proteobacteria)]|nr:DeoR/GlpR family DNA-binding transcription regulator [Paracoccus sp. (in: a-proteobacteria)]